MAIQFSDTGGYDFVSGEDAVLRVQTKDSAGSLTAPTSLTFVVYEGSIAAVTYTLGSDGEIETIATGDYQLRHLTTASATPVRIRILVTAVSSSYTLKELYEGTLIINPAA